MLETERRILREFRPEDLKDVIDWGEASDAHDAPAVAQAFLDFCFREYQHGGVGPVPLLACSARSNRSCEEVESVCLSGAERFHCVPQLRASKVVKVGVLLPTIRTSLKLLPDV